MPSLILYHSMEPMADLEDVLKNETFKNELIDIIRLNSRELNPFPTKEKAKLVRCGQIKSIIFDIYGTLLISASGDIGTVKGYSKSGIFLNSLKKSGIKVIDSDAGENVIFWPDESDGYVPSIQSDKLWVSETPSRAGELGGNLIDGYGIMCSKWMTLPLETQGGNN